MESMKKTFTFTRPTELAEDSALAVRPLRDAETTSVIQGAWKTLMLAFSLLALGTALAVTAQGLADVNLLLGGTLDAKQIDILNKVVDSAIPPLVFMFGTLMVLMVLIIRRLFSWLPRYGYTGGGGGAARGGGHQPPPPPGRGGW